ncbi:MAG: isoprenylcysteine carboxylmethyltransferase family protein [Anaerolineaceae bacterium]|nr:isoprenylcysteine carboxylmethyltransferase family protein [Anaerolineaceae bacterium]
MFLLKLGITLIISAIIICVSWYSLKDVNHHGFYRFFAWETILVLFVLNVNYWIIAPFSFMQILSWIFLSLSLLLIIMGVYAFRFRGNLDPERNDIALLGIEKTTKLVNSGIYGHIRHPFYSSLLLLGWGIALKHITWPVILLAVITTLLLFITSRKEEKENVNYFGETYIEYMKNSKMFIPFLF